MPVRITPPLQLYIIYLRDGDNWKRAAIVSTEAEADAWAIDNAHHLRAGAAVRVCRYTREPWGSG